jgi:hypothetical protein
LPHEREGWIKAPTTKVQQLKSRALYDEQTTKNAQKSLAVSKAIWKGEHGRFNKAELLKWFGTYNNARIREVHGTMTPDEQIRRKKGLIETGQFDAIQKLKNQEMLQAINQASD